MGQDFVFLVSGLTTIEPDSRGSSPAMTKENASVRRAAATRRTEGDRLPAAVVYSGARNGTRSSTWRVARTTALMLALASAAR